jgi:hypothetical protein
VAMMRSQLRMAVCGVVAAVIVVAWIVEPPGALEGVGLAVVLVVMIAIVLQELRRAR